MITSTILFRLIFAHILSDFFFQTESMVQGKLNKGIKHWGYLTLHSLIHAIVTFIMLAQWTLWYVPAVIFITHFITDMIKSKFDNRKPSVFLADQAAHIIILVLLWLYILPINTQDVVTNVLSCLPHNYWLLLTAYFLMLKPTSILLSLLLNKWSLSDSINNSLSGAGKWIGYIERIMVLTFVITNNIEGVGFLLAAKSVFRFGDLNKSKDIKMTEYVMIGTMTSFAIAIITGLIVK
ncbi:MAG: DUF3307 domain-containing protein [Prevotellaceae bacterium]|nr:DUF3307 domain-containing protein [Prevotellaceae bacterium]